MHALAALIFSRVSVAPFLMIFDAAWTSASVGLLYPRRASVWGSECASLSFGIDAPPNSPGMKTIGDPDGCTVDHADLSVSTAAHSTDSCFAKPTSRAVTTIPEALAVAVIASIEFLVSANASCAGKKTSRSGGRVSWPSSGVLASINENLKQLAIVQT